MEQSIIERTGTVSVSDRLVPWVSWSPAGPPPETLVLIGHGASGDKYENYVVALGHSLAKRGVASVAIDGPIHGGRRSGDSATMPFFDFAARWSSDATLTDCMIDDWRTVLDLFLRDGSVSPTAAVGYWGLSMGTILGLPLVAAEPRITACVLGLMGATGPTKERIVNDAQAMRIPTMFLVQWDDQLFHRRDAFELFNLIASSDKILIATPGNHGAVTGETFKRSAEFLINRLTKSR
jgi:alpha-beta hydrolase superfamily lysophospholipase